jgi:amino acid adenylation domain-containing protein
LAAAYRGESLTYEALDRRANRLALHLRARGVGPEVQVGLCMERSLELVVGMLGVLKAGGAYVPLDSGYPAERIAYALGDSRVPVLLTQSRLAGRLPVGGAEVVVLDTDWPDIAGHDAAPPPVEPDPEHLAYVLYTSGSTGKPKGVAVPHRALSNHMAWMAGAFPLDAHDRVLQKTPIGFDASVWEFWAPLIAGATLVLAEPGGHQDPAYLVRTMRTERITTLQVVPTLLRVLLDEPELAECSGLRRLFCGGEALPAELVERALSVLDVGMYNVYGPTETCIQVTCHPCAAGAGGETAPIGRPIPNTRAQVLGAGLEPVPAGVAGELYVGGAALARGYLNRPDLTADRFVPDPVGEPGARLYRTGDRVRRAADGTLEFLGRMDHQVKVRGFRIELGEIEAVLARHPAVRECAALARQDGPGDRVLVAYAVATEAAAPGAAELREWLNAELPEYMVPGVFVWLERFPLTSSGKIDRQALPAPEARSGPDSGYVAPRTPVEEAVARAWAEALGTQRVGVYDDFFDLGGHSLRAIQIATRLRRELGVELPVATLLRAGTVAEAAARIAERAAAPAAEEPPVPRAPRDLPIPAGYAQEAVWFLHQIAPDLQAYNFQATFRLLGALDVPALERALGEIVRRHEILRTSYAAVRDRPFQVIHDAGPVRLPLTDLSDLAPAEREARIQQLRGEEFGRIIDLGRLPLIRWRLLRLGAEEHEILHVEHHFVHDGWSFGVYLRELKTLYEAFSRGEPSPLPELPVQFADFAVWHREWLAGPEGEAQLEFWRSRLAATPLVIELPTDRPRPPVFSHRGDAVRWRFPAQLSRAARTFARRQRTTFYATALSVFEALMFRYSGQAGFCVGISMANRRREEFQHLIGMLVNMVPLCADLSGGPTFRELVARVYDELLEAQANQEVPFEKVVERVQPPRTLAHNLLFQVSFNFHDSPMPEFRLGEVEMVPTEAHNIGCTKFDIHVMVVPRSEQRKGAAEDEVTFIWEYSTDLYDRPTIERMRGHYEMLLEAACADPDRRITELPLLTDGERKQVVEEWNATRREYPAGACVHHLFEAQAERTPAADAAVFGAERISYAELDGRANRLARFLRRLGVGPDERVGLFMERGPEMAVAVLGTLKAGGAYVPLDPGYPRERLEYMAGDSGVGVLLTQQRLADRAPSRSAVPVRLDADWPTVARESAAPLSVEVAPDNLAYVVYTSGSTGRPKGVSLPHRALVNLIEWHREALLGASRTLQFASLSFDASFHEMFAAWSTGGALVLITGETQQDAAALAREVRDQRVEKAILPVSLLHHLAEECHGRERALLGSLREVTATGEQLRVTPAVARLFEALGGCLLNNHYGPSETHVVTAHTLAGAPGGWPVYPAIGRPVANTQIHLLDGELEPVPVGIPGELYVGGVALARGYLHRPDLTAERFVPDPLGPAAGARLYRTGDRARRLPDGTLEYLGRGDQQVKIRGFRIELGEIEAVLQKCPSVSEAVVIAREDVPGERRLVAYLVPADGAEPTPGELRAHLRKRLPDYMVPAAFVALDALPLGPTGKVERRALPAPDGVHGRRAEFVAPRTAAEQVLAVIWADVLHVERVGIGDDFFELGGHSLLATRVNSRVRDVFQVDLGLPALFNHPTVEALAEEVARACGGMQTAEEIARIFLEFEALPDEGLNAVLS